MKFLKTGTARQGRGEDSLDDDYLETWLVAQRRYVVAVCCGVAAGF